MAGFTDAQIKWLDAVVPKQPPKPTTQPNDQNDTLLDLVPTLQTVPQQTPVSGDDLLKSFKADEKKLKQREDALNKINEKIAAMRDDLKAAQSFQVTWDPDDTANFWNRASKARSMNWSEANAPEDKRKGGKKSTVDKKDRMIRDIEIDTKHDLKGKYKVKDEDVTRVLEMHSQLIELQTEMENSVGDDGKPLFTARDIERELWSPLIKSDIIPSNAVADKYSQEAQVFNGAAEVYEERLKEYSKKASKHEKAQRALKITGDFVLMAGAMAGSAIRLAEFDGASMSMAEKREFAELDSLNKATPFESGSPEALRLEELGAMSQSSKDVAFETAAVSTTVAFLQGAFDVTSKSLDKESETKSWKIAEAIADAVTAAAVGAIGTYAAGVFANQNETRQNKDEARGDNTVVRSMVTAGLAGSKMIFRLKEALDAPENGKDKFIKAIAISLGDAIGSSFAAFDQPQIKDDSGTIVSPGTNGEWGKVGGFVAVAIAGAANITEIIRMIDAAKKEGRKLEPGALASAFGLTVLGPIMAGNFEQASDSVRQDLGSSGSGGNTFSETDREKEMRNLDGLQEIQALRDMAKTMPNMNQLIAATKELPGEKELAKKVASEANERNGAKAKAELKALSEEINKDPEKKKNLVKSIEDENEVRKAEIMKLIALASTPTAMVDPTAKNSAAKAAMDRLIAESEASKAKWAALDMITAGGVGMLVSFLPAAGLAVAIRQLVSDVAWLIKKSKELNLWQKNMALTFGNDSVYGPAINERLANAEIQVSQKAINVVFSIVGVTAESLRLGDITGIATGVAVGNTMARALTDFGYKMQKEYAIEKGWRLYKKARSSEGAGDRKLARKAMSWNSTLSKCVLAYGIVKDNDPIAAEVARNCGLSPELLADENDVCQRVVTYFLSVYSDDPVVMRRIPVVKDWHPAMPKLELENWLKFKAAAVISAVPPLAEASTQSTVIDTALTKIDSLWKGKGYTVQRDALENALNVARTKAAEGPPPTDEDSEESEEDRSISEDDDREPTESGSGDEVIDPIEADPRVKAAKATYKKFLTDAAKHVDESILAFKAYIPVNGPQQEGAVAPWTEGSPHRDMTLVVESLSAQAMILRSEIAYDLKAL